MRVVRLRVRLGVLVGVLAAAGPVSPAAAADEGPWGWPLTGSPAVAHDFAPPAVRYAAGHRGVDLAAAAGDPVRAAGAGRVTYAGLLAGRGVVVVSHGALRTTYEPVTAAVPVGADVALGELIATLEPAHAGCAAPACLHWGLRRGEDYLDPLRLVARRPVRLLPVEEATGQGAGGQGALRAGAPGDAAPEGAELSGAQPGAVLAGAAPTPTLPAAVDEPRWSLRATEAPLGAAAVAALVLGIGLLTRPRPQPPAPVSGGVAAVALPAEPEPPGTPGELLDLDSARLRRRAG